MYIIYNLSNVYSFPKRTLSVFWMAAVKATPMDAFLLKNIFSKKETLFLYCFKRVTEWVYILVCWRYSTEKAEILEFYPDTIDLWLKAKWQRHVNQKEKKWFIAFMIKVSVDFFKGKYLMLHLCLVKIITTQQTFWIQDIQSLNLENITYTHKIAFAHSEKFKKQNQKQKKV